LPITALYSLRLFGFHPIRAGACCLLLLLRLSLPSCIYSIDDPRWSLVSWSLVFLSLHFTFFLVTQWNCHGRHVV